MPEALGHPLHQFCATRGIRDQYGFGEELRGLLPVFTRSLNARWIMSNRIPTINSPEEIPYCIWYPDTASKTYMELVRLYPQMAYQVGRACAVAGYTTLYRELDILPDVHIAEEARECGNLAIFEAIVSQPVRYSVMDDYTRSVDTNDPRVANLNGDTCVSWMLDIKQELKDPKYQGLFSYRRRMFNLTADMHIDEHASDKLTARLQTSRLELRLLHEPLPVDLPTVQKDILIAMAAYTGNIDRYARLRRPVPIPGESTYCLRGVYHSTFFAIWFVNQRQEGIFKYSHGVASGINARFIMNNVLSGAPYPPSKTPYLIWWPTTAHSTTYRHLAKIQPDMLLQIIHACIYAGYDDLFDELLPSVTPDAALYHEAKVQRSPHFRQALDACLKLLGLTEYPDSLERWALGIESGFDRPSNCVMNHIDDGAIATVWNWPYDGRSCDAADVELNVCLPDAWRIPSDDPTGFSREIDYEDWPPQHAMISPGK